MYLWEEQVGLRDSQKDGGQGRPLYLQQPNFASGNGFDLNTDKTKKNVYLYVARIRIQNSKSIMLIHTDLSEGSGETDMQ
jgi:hypothetical protein